MSASTRDVVLSVEGLKTWFHSRDGVAKSVDGVTFDLARGETLAIVGESGSGKSVTSLSIMGLLPKPAGRIEAGKIRFRDRKGQEHDLARATPATLRRIRGAEIAMIFQEPMTSLNPLYTVGDQIAEAILLHEGGSRADALRRAREMLERVEIPAAERRVNEYPHQMSGGMRQRVMIALALACNPAVLIADEPTTALDVTVQAQILDLLRRLQAEMNMSILFITHNLGVVAEIAHRVAVMYAGRVVEDAGVYDLFEKPTHPYTRGLLSCLPTAALLASGERLRAIPGNVPSVLSLPAVPSRALPAGRRQLPPRRARTDSGAARAPCALHQGDSAMNALPRTRFPRRRPWSRPPPPLAPARRPRRRSAGAHRGTEGPFPDLAVAQRAHGQGGGRRHLRRAAQHHRRPGRRVRLGQDHHRPRAAAPVRADRRPHPVRRPGHHEPQRKQMLPWRRRMQIVFQDPYASLNPRMTVSEILGEALDTHKLAQNRRAARIGELLERVGLNADHARRYPHEFSGGQRQRIGIARALAVEPDFIVADEPVSALDVSVQAQVLNLLQDLQRDLGLTMLFVAHDLAVVDYLCDEVVVMYLGRVMERGPTSEVYARPRHLYSRPAVGRAGAGPARAALAHPAQGRHSQPGQPAVGLRVPHRCPHATEACAAPLPPAANVGPGHHVACIRLGDPELAA